MINSCWLVPFWKITKNYSHSVLSSDWKNMLRDVYTLLVIRKGSIGINSFFDTIWTQLLQVTWFFNMVVSISCAWGDCPHNSLNTKDMISLASFCQNKSKSLSIICKQHKNWDRSRAVLLNFSINKRLIIFRSPGKQRTCDPRISLPQFVEWLGVFNKEFWFWN